MIQLEKCSKHNVTLLWDALRKYHYCEECAEEHGFNPSGYSKIINVPDFVYIDGNH